MGAYEIDNNWTLVRRRELNGEKTIISIWSLKRNRDLYGSLIKHKSLLLNHVGMHQWEVNCH